MKALLGRNVSPRAALAVVVLALVVSVVGGRELRPSEPSAPPAAAPAAQEARRASERGTELALALESLERPALGEPQANLFAPRRAPAAARPVRAAPPAPPPVPVAPPLPYRYLGRFDDGENTAVYLARGEQPVLAAPGAALEGGYRVEEVSSAAITLVYVPLGTRHLLPIPPRD